MANQKETLIRIESPDGTKQYSVSEYTYSHTQMAGLGGQTYKDAGYTVVSYEDGTPYGEEGATPTTWSVDKNAATVGVGEGATEATTLEGEKASDELLAATGVTLEGAPETAPAARRTSSKAEAEAE